ncbi:Uncharacterized protein APZ42_009868, partial [Daphnia magna]
IKIASKNIAYPKKSKKQILLRKRLAFFVSTTSFSTSLCENIDFHGYTSGLDPRHTLPCRKRLTRDIIELAKKRQIADQKANSISSLEAYGYSRYMVEEGAFVILLRYHSSLYLCRGCNLESRVPIIVTDNGSNMVKAFKQVRANHVEDVIESVVANTISTEINAEADAVHEDNLFSDSSDIEVDGEVDVSFNEDADIERPAQEDIPTYSISQVDTVEDATTLDISETTSEI